MQNHTAWALRQPIADLLLRDELEELRLKLFILLILENSCEIYLNLLMIFLYYSIFFIRSISVRFRTFLEVQQDILGPVHSILVMSFMFSSNNYYSFRYTSMILTLSLEDDLDALSVLRALSLLGLGLTSGNFLVCILGPVV